MKVLRIIPALLAAGWITAIDMQPVLAQVQAKPTRPAQAEPKHERPERPERRDHDRGRPDRPERARPERVERQAKR